MNTTTTQQTAKLILNTEFIMSAEDITILNNLPDNLPDTKLTAKQKDLVNTLYWKYCSKLHYGWGNDLYELELKEKWPSAGRVKQHEAKRFILGWLSVYNQYYKEMEGKKALDFLMNEINCREADRILVSKAYSVK